MRTKIARTHLEVILSGLPYRSASASLDAHALFASKPLVRDAETGKEKEDDEGDEERNKKEEGQEQDAPSARLPRLLHGPDGDETSTLPIVASVARILAKCVNLSSLMINRHLESISCKVTEDHDPAVMWAHLTQLEFAWSASCIDLLPVLARLSHLQHLTDLSLLLDARNEHDQPRGVISLLPAWLGTMLPWNTDSSTKDRRRCTIYKSGFGYTVLA